MESGNHTGTVTETIDDDPTQPYGFVPLVKLKARMAREGGGRTWYERLDDSLQELGEDVCQTVRPRDYRLDGPGDPGL